MSIESQFSPLALCRHKAFYMKYILSTSSLIPPSYTIRATIFEKKVFDLKNSQKLNISLKKNNITFKQNF